MTKSTGVGRGGLRDPKGGRPKGSKTKIYRPHVERVLALDGIMPKQVLLHIMREHFAAKRWAAAERTASLIAPYCHPRLSATALTVRPSIAEQMAEMTDDELRESVEEMKRMAGLTEDDLSTVKPKGSA
jgi:hypothetical protein